MKEIVKKAKQDSWKDFGEKMERNSKGNQKLFYRMLKSLRKGKQTRNMHITAKNGDILENERSIMARWKEHFEDILNIDQVGLTTAENKDSEKDEEKTVAVSYDRIETEEVVEAIKTLKRGKAAGHDNITAEMIKNMGENGIEVMEELFNKI